MLQKQVYLGKLDTCERYIEARFTDKYLPIFHFFFQIPIIATGVAIDVPVYVPNSNVDLKICTFDRLYQDSVVVKNRYASLQKCTC